MLFVLIILVRDFVVVLNDLLKCSASHQQSLLPGEVEASPEVSY